MENPSMPSLLYFYTAIAKSRRLITEVSIYFCMMWKNTQSSGPCNIK